MNKSVWIIILLVIAVAILATLGLVYYYNFGRATESIDLTDIPDLPPLNVTFTDEQIVRFEVQLTDADPGQRLDAVVALNNAAAKHPDRVAPILLEALANEDPRVRYMAAKQLGTIKYAPAATAIVKLLDDPDKDVITAAARALVKLQDVGLKAIMEALALNTLKNVDRALIIVKQITGRSFPQGERGRTEALEFWAQYKSKL